MSSANNRFLRFLSAGIVLQLGLSRHLDGQTGIAVPASVTRVVTAVFPEPNTRLAENAVPWLRTCQAIFQNAMTVNPDVRVPGEDRQFSLKATAAGRRCLQRMGDVSTLPAFEWPFLLRFAIGVDEDTLAQTIIARQLAAGASARDRADVLERAIELFVHNQWRALYQDPSDHRTTAHVALARKYAAHLDTLQPTAQVLVNRLRVVDILDKLNDTVWNAETQLARMRRRVAIAQSVPFSAVPAEDTSTIRGVLRDIYELARLTYLQTPTHANMTRWIATRDSLLNIRKGETLDSLVGRPAPRLDCDFWFNRPAGSPSVVPAPGVVSLLVFIDPKEGRIDNSQSVTRLGGAPNDLEELRQLYVRYPKLQITLVAMTKGWFLNQDLRERPAQEAGLINQYFTTQLRLPGTVCVLQTKYHTEPGATAVPYSSPVLDRFHLDPREYGAHRFVVDAEGWLVPEQFDTEGHLVERLFAQ